MKIYLLVWILVLAAFVMVVTEESEEKATSETQLLHDLLLEEEIPEDEDQEEKQQEFPSMLQRSGRRFTPTLSRAQVSSTVNPSVFTDRPATTSTTRYYISLSTAANDLLSTWRPIGPTYLHDSTGCLSYVRNCGRHTCGKDHPPTTHPAICFGTRAGESCCKRMVIESGQVGMSDCLSDCDVGEHAICSNRHPATKSAECRVVTRSSLSSVTINCCVADYLIY